MKRVKREFPSFHFHTGKYAKHQVLAARMIEIVPEIPEIHAEAIEDLFDRTFGPGHFAKTAERLREFSASLPDISRVALKGNEVIAVVRAWPVKVEQGGAAIFVGPVAVDPAYRGDRLGVAVTNKVLDAGREAGWSLALLIGASEYFCQCGFEVVDSQRFQLPGPQDYDRVMLCELTENTRHFRGEIRAAPTL